jgi:hypothetical protein
MTAEYKPEHLNANIHGMVESDGNTTCKTREGTMCTGCDTASGLVPEIPYFQREVNGEILVFASPEGKPHGEKCVFAVDGKGCGLLLNPEAYGRIAMPRPSRCYQYHCSKDIHIAMNPSATLADKNSAYQRIAGANYAALQNGEITKEDAEFNFENHIPVNPIKNR